MADRNTLKGLKVTMKKHPTSLKLEGSLKEKLENYNDSENPLVLYEGPVRDLCHLAPNNVNTMAVGALSAQNLGFDKVQACLVADLKSVYSIILFLNKSITINPCLFSKA